MSMLEDWDPWEVSIDGGVTPSEHFQGMEAMTAFLATPAGERALNWLRSFTVERTIAATVTSDSALWHLEGQRALVLGLQARVRQFQDRRS